MRRGEVYTLKFPGDDSDRRRYVAVLSADEHNEAADTSAVMAAPIKRRPGKAYSVATNEADPVSGYVHVRELFRAPVAWLVEPAGTLTGATVTAASVALRDFLDTP